MSFGLHGRRVAITADAVGGVWTYTLDLASGLRAAGADLRILVLGPALRPDQRDELARRGLGAVETGHPLEWLAADEAELRGAARAVAASARSWGAELVHLHTPALAALADFGCPVVAVNHSCVATWWAAVRGGPLPVDLAWRAAAVGTGLRRADLALAPTRAYAAATAETYGLPEPPLAIRNGRSAGDVATEPEREEVFAAGRLWDEGKNMAALDRVAPLLPWPVRVAGDTVAPHGAQAALDHVDLLGRLPERAVRARLAGRPIFVSPARFEPFGLAVLEAAQAGCALVLNDIATFRELWDGAALFVDADDTAALAAAIRGLIGDRTRRHAMGQAAQARAARYGAEATVAATISAYAGLLPAAPRMTLPVALHA